MRSITSGTWPTMVTPYTDENKVDHETLDKLVEWYIERKVDGMFAVCQSSEMYYLDLEERVYTASRIVKATAGRVQVIGSGHISDSESDQIEELNRMADTGIAALVLLTNHFTPEDGTDDQWKLVCERLLSKLPEAMPLGLYECPFPYKRLMSPELLRWCADTGRFIFLKDTSCDPDSIQAKINAVEGTPLKLYNANAATYLLSLKMGAAGFSGVMANFYPEIIAWLFSNWRDDAVAAEEMQAFIGAGSLAERQSYPINAKYYLQLEGVFRNQNSRIPGREALTAPQRLEIEQLRTVSQMYINRYINQ
ncbi:MAG: dihydrodipicolinate synthase family protein [Spirochaetales bacterium]|jgi:4-hydroxy-tetrahydrodipicolinate synthase|nr:dihydrodipicolinate synthase family protein [Spirochaetales bacterium]